ncbi:MAG: hypothetical protein GF313_00745, partial [Caldithrix sp.]|nr:hypothetical protein [Caldithrix sp.]
NDETLSLFGFGLDSFVEVMSGLGILHFVMRLQKNPSENADVFERRALRITGSAFYILTGGLVVTSIHNMWIGHQPITTFWGVVIAAVSIVSMWLLIHFKVQVARQLNSAALLADANCTKACMYLSFTLLIASLGYTFTGIGWIDSLGALAIAYFALKEGREAFEKARGELNCACVSDTCATD